MASIPLVTLWVGIDANDKYPGEPDGAWMLHGTLGLDIPVELTILPCQKLGIAIRRNKYKTKDNQPDFLGEVYMMKEKTEGGA